MDIIAILQITGLGSLAAAVTGIVTLRAITARKEKKARGERSELNNHKRESDQLEDINRTEKAEINTIGECDRICTTRPEELEKELNEVNSTIEKENSEVQALGDHKADLKAIIEPEIRNGRITRHANGKLEVKHTHGAEKEEIEVSNRYLSRVANALDSIEANIQKSAVKIEGLKEVASEIEKQLSSAPSHERRLNEITGQNLISQQKSSTEAADQKSRTPSRSSAHETPITRTDVDGSASPLEGFSRREQINEGMSRITDQAAHRRSLGSPTRGRGNK